jgi:hypothetical protein
MTTGNGSAQVLVVRDKLIRERNETIALREAEGRAFYPAEGRVYDDKIKALETFANSQDLQSFVDLKALALTDAVTQVATIKTTKAALRKVETDFFLQYEKNILEFENRGLTEAERAEYTQKIKGINEDEAIEILWVNNSIPGKLAGLDNDMVELAIALSDLRNLAALEAYRANGNEYWHNLFLQTTVFADPTADLADQGHDQRDAAFEYLRLTGPTIRADIQANATEAVDRETGVENALSFYASNNWTKSSFFGPVFFGNGLGVAQNQTLLRSYIINGNVNNLAPAINSTQYIYGGNPKNMTYTTGIGLRDPKSPLVIDQRSRGVAPPPGIALYGPFDSSSFDATSYFAFGKDFDFLGNDLFPTIDKWAASESYFDAFLIPVNTELTVHQTMAPNTFTLGILAARDGAITPRANPVPNPNPTPNPTPTPPTTLIDQLVTASNETTQVDPLALLNLVNTSTNGTPTIVYAPSGPQAISVPLAPGEVLRSDSGPAPALAPDPTPVPAPAPIPTPVPAPTGGTVIAPIVAPAINPLIVAPPPVSPNLTVTIPTSDNVLTADLVDPLSAPLPVI